MSSSSPPWCERLARRLSEVAGRHAEVTAERSRWLHARRAELLAEAGGRLPPDAMDGLARRAADLDRDLALKQAELVALAERQRALPEREQRLREALAASFAELCASCEQAVARLPLLGLQTLEQWLAWLESWHRDSQRPFEPNADWPRRFRTRTTIADAMSLVEPVVERIERLEGGRGATGLSGIDVAAEVESQQAELHRLEQANAARLAAVAQDYGRVVADLPDPAGASSLAHLERIESLLLFLEITLGRFAASARIERQMLEALA